MYGWRGRANSSGVVAVSTTNPAYITQIRWVMSATTPRSWVMISTEVPLWTVSSRMTSMTCAWIVTSRAVVGSSAISRRGFNARAIAIITRWRIPPESWCGYARNLPRAIRDPDHPEEISGTFVGLGLGHLPVVEQALGQLAPDREHRVQAGERVLEDVRDLVAPDAAQLGFGEGEQVATAEEDAPVLDAAGRFREEPRQGKLS